jgi:hypothetical protein
MLVDTCNLERALHLWTFDGNPKVYEFDKLTFIGTDTLDCDCDYYEGYGGLFEYDYEIHKSWTFIECLHETHGYFSQPASIKSTSIRYEVLSPERPTSESMVIKYFCGKDTTRKQLITAELKTENEFQFVLHPNGMKIIMHQDGGYTIQQNGCIISTLEDNCEITRLGDGDTDVYFYEDNMNNCNKVLILNWGDICSYISITID